MSTDLHHTVLLHEAVDALALAKSSRGHDIVVDATGGMGGHSMRILETLGEKGTLIIIDKDPVSLEKIQSRVGITHTNVCYVCDDFRNIAEIVRKNGFTEVTAILADLGWNSDQFQNGGKGFSFNVNEPLLMTYGDPEANLFTARDIVNEWKEETIADVLYGYADERFARRIARVICEKRKKEAIETTDDLVAAVLEAVPKKMHHTRIHPATKTFQALRIAVNGELEALPIFMEDSLALLKKHGRLAIISFHSIEDRMVKNYFREKATTDEAVLITKKPLVPSEEEVQKNPRARSAKLRILEKI